MNIFEQYMQVAQEQIAQYKSNIKTFTTERLIEEYNHPSQPNADMIPEDVRRAFCIDEIRNR